MSYYNINNLALFPMGSTYLTGKITAKGHSVLGNQVFTENKCEECG